MSKHVLLLCQNPPFAQECSMQMYLCTSALQCECRAFKQIFQNFMFKGKSITGLIMYKLLKGTEGFIYVQCSFKDSCIKYFVSKCSHCTSIMVKLFFDFMGSHRSPEIPLGNRHILLTIIKLSNFHHAATMHYLFLKLSFDTWHKV